MELRGDLKCIDQSYETLECNLWVLNDQKDLKLMFPVVGVAHIGGFTCIYLDFDKLRSMVAAVICVGSIGVLPWVLMEVFRRC